MAKKDYARERGTLAGYDLLLSFSSAALNAHLKRLHPKRLPIDWKTSRMSAKISKYELAMLDARTLRGHADVTLTLTAAESDSTKFTGELTLRAPIKYADLRHDIQTEGGCLPRYLYATPSIQKLARTFRMVHPILIDLAGARLHDASRLRDAQGQPLPPAVVEVIREQAAEFGRQHRAPNPFVLTICGTQRIAGTLAPFQPTAIETTSIVAPGASPDEAVLAFNVENRPLPTGPDAGVFAGSWISDAKENGVLVLSRPIVFHQLLDRLHEDLAEFWWAPKLERKGPASFGMLHVKQERSFAPRPPCPQLETAGTRFELAATIEVGTPRFSVAWNITRIVRVEYSTIHHPLCDALWKIEVTYKQLFEFEPLGAGNEERGILRLKKSRPVTTRAGFDYNGDKRRWESMAVDDATLAAMNNREQVIKNNLHLMNLVRSEKMFNQIIDLSLQGGRSLHSAVQSTDIRIDLETLGVDVVMPESRVNYWNPRFDSNFNLLVSISQQ